MCKDSHEPHCHRGSPVDLAVKSKVLKGALQLILPEYQSAEMERGYRAARDRTEEDSLVVDHESLDETYEDVYGSKHICGDLEQFFTNVARLFENVVGKRKLNSYKWRKCAVALYTAHRQSNVVSGNVVEGKVARKDGDSEDAHARARYAESLFRKCKQIFAGSCNRACYHDEEIALFITLLFEWAGAQIREDRGCPESLGRALTRAINVVLLRE